MFVGHHIIYLLIYSLFGG